MLINAHKDKSIIKEIMKIRAVQLDLARQPETMAYIRDFIAFAADFGFNTLVLYKIFLALNVYLVILHIDIYSLRSHRDAEDCRL